MNSVKFPTYITIGKTSLETPWVLKVYLHISMKTIILVKFTFSKKNAWFWFCCSGRIPRLSLNQHSLYVGLVEKPPTPPLAGEQYGKMEPKYPEGGHCQSVLRHQGVFNVPLYYYFLNNSVETAAPFNVVSHPRCSEPRN